MTELEAELYALTHRGNPGDLEFYARVCAGASRVLELGTGYGRLLPALLGERRHVVGLDREPRLLRAARRRALQLPRAARARLRLVRGDMQQLALGARFDRILLPYNGLYCLLGRRALLRCLRSVRAHLAPEGEFVFDVWAADEFARHASSSAHRDDDEAIVSLAHRGQTWDVFEQSRLASGAQRLDVTYTYRSRERGRRVTCCIEQRYAPARELTELLRAAGLRVRARWGGFTEQRFGRGSEQLVVVASR
ncbi:MAG TPA: class I SAM-dependent methyltransferase [Polyangiaceae bacterium]|nr:class I SAM-dependent methyltransferase [Polyangiaceae bacterium]